MIINFSVENFGSIKEKQILSFLANKSDHLEDYYIIEPIKGLRLNKLVLIYGANASGKTTVLKALDFLRQICTDPFDKKTEKFDFEPFLFDENTPKQNTKFELEFVQNGGRYLYEVELNKNCIVHERLYNFNPKKALVFERMTDENKELTSIKFGNKISKKKHLEESLEIFTLWNNTVFGGYQKANLDIIELNEIKKWFVNFMSLFLPNGNIEDILANVFVEDNGIKDDILNILSKANFEITDIIVNEIEEKLPIDFKNQFPELAKVLEKDEIKKVKKIYFKHNVKNKNYFLNIENESLGTQKYFNLVGLLGPILFLNSFLPIDELESSLHPDLFNHFLLTYLVNGKKESQLITTTHNREILNNKDMFRDDAIWFTDKNEDSATELYSLADFDSSVVRDTTNVLNAYKSGKFGGVPNLGDYYIDLEDGE